MVGENDPWEILSGGGGLLNYSIRQVWFVASPLVARVFMSCRKGEAPAEPETTADPRPPEAQLKDACGRRRAKARLRIGESLAPPADRDAPRHTFTSTMTRSIA